MTEVQLTVDEKRNAKAAEEAQMTAIASAIKHLPVEDGTARLSAAEWVLAPGKMETEGVETIAEIAAKLLGRETAEEDDGEPDSNYVEPPPCSDAGRSKKELFVSFRVCGRQYSSVL
eukprot:Em0013g1042a